MSLPGPDARTLTPATAKTEGGARVRATDWGWRHAGRKAWAW